MEYFAAVQEGRARVKRSVEVLQRVAGPSYPVFFLKAGRQDWAPVGVEERYALVRGKDGTAALVICDAEGNAKAISAWLSADAADASAKALKAEGLERHEGEVKLPV